MTIRLNKVTRDLNVGISTIVEFLQKKGFTVEANPNTRISEEQYALLTKEFSSDKDLRLKSEMLTRDSRNNRRESAVEEVRTETTSREIFKQKPAVAQTTPVQPAAPKEEPKPATVAATSTTTAAAQQPTTPKASETSPTTVVEKPAAVEQPKEEQPMQQQRSQTSTAEQKPSQPQAQQPAVQTAEKPQQAAQAPQVATPAPSQPTTATQPQAENTQKEVSKESAPVAPKSATDSKSSVEEKPAEPVQKEEAQEETIFKISRTEPVSKINVIGRIDLAALNQSTRPKKKSKEERKKEREEKERQRMDQRKQMKEAIMKEIRRDDSSAKGDSSSSESKKKRARINKDRVDIEEMRSSGSNRGDRRNERSERGDRNERKEQGKRNKDRNKQQQQPIVREVNEEDVARQVKETLARLTSKGAKSKASKYRKEKREMAAERNEELEKREMAESKVLKITEFVTANELASMMDISVTQVIATCMSVGIMVSINQRLDAETINMVAEEFGFKTEYVSAEVQEAVSEEEDDENDLVPRAPIVTVMGHVDHGKTSLLDYIRNTNVIAGEAGGITQHIGAYSVTLNSGRKVTFLDTPGHEAFTAMRARGAQATDIAIIIIAADDSVMPTTKEAIAHAQAAGVPMVFAINKIDKPGANPDRIREDLANMNLLVEEWGGKYQCQEISAKKGIGVHDLLDKVLLEADLLDLKANPNRRATGTIIESSLDKGRGYVSTVLVANGTLKVGDIVLAGTSWGRVKAMFNERNANIKSAAPAEPAIILGLNGAPTAGDQFHVIETEQEAREIANKREQLQREQGLRTQKRLTLGDISHRIARGEFHELNVIVKGDTDGSVEALSDSFIKLSTEKVQVNVVNKAVGQISENDVMLASASDAVIVGFQVRPSADARKAADREGVEINTYSIIYDAIDDIKSAMVGMLDKVKKEIVTGQVEVKQTFKISKVGTIAGGLVTEGKVHAKDKARVIRDGIVLRTAEIGALKRYKDDVKEVVTGMECGLSLVNYNDIQEGDVIETFTEIEVEQKL